MFFLQKYVRVRTHVLLIFFFHIHKHTRVDMHEGTYPFPQADKIHDLQTLFLEHISQVFGHAAILKMSNPKAPSPRLAVLWHGRVGTEGQEHLKANLMCCSELSTEDTGRGETVFCYCHICMYPAEGEGVCLQTYHSTDDTRCKSTRSILCGLWQILGFHMWRAACTNGMPTNRALLAFV